jgi:prepilin-type N-terminal cleavage/methylation domain-containing protein
MVPNHAGHARGFTLVEALLVMVMGGILLAVAIPRFSTLRQSYLVDSAAHQFAGDLRRTQVEAIKRNRTVELAVTGGSTYSIQSVPPPALITVYYARAFEAGVAFNGGATSARMRAFGPPTTGATTFIIQSGTAQKSVIVSAAGRISVQ